MGSTTLICSFSLIFIIGLWLPFQMLGQLKALCFIMEIWTLSDWWEVF